MASGFECGSFTWPNTTASQTITLVGTFTVKAVKMWTAGPGSAGFSAGGNFSIGVGTRRSGATQSGCMGIINIDNVATSDNARVRNTTLLHVLSSTSATDYTITLDSLGSGTIGITSSNGTNTNGDILHYMAFGGSGITDAIVLNWTMDAISGAEVVTGTGFAPDALFAIDSDLATANSITAGIMLAFGFASSSTKFTVSPIIHADDADTMTSAMLWAAGTLTDCCIARINTGVSASVDAKWDLDSFDSDGASLGVVDPPTNTDRVATLLFLKGGTWEAGAIAKDVDTGTDDFTLTNGSLTPNGAVFGWTSRTTTGTSGNIVDFCVGSTDGTRQIVAGNTGLEAINTATDSFRNNDRCIEELTGNTPTETSEASFSSFGAGTFQLNWATNGGIANLIGYMAFNVSDFVPLDFPVELRGAAQMIMVP